MEFCALMKESRYIFIYAAKINFKALQVRGLALSGLFCAEQGETVFQEI